MNRFIALLVCLAAAGCAAFCIIRQLAGRHCPMREDFIQK